SNARRPPDSPTSESEGSYFERRSPRPPMPRNFPPGRRNAPPPSRISSMMWTIVWCVTVLFNGRDGLEPTDRLFPPTWKGTPWGPEATVARASGEIPPIVMTPLMLQWEKWGKQVLRDGDIVFRRADARLLLGRFPFSRFTAAVSGSEYSHTG